MSVLSRSIAPTELPEGHDDRKSHWFIPADLREHYEPDFNELTVMDFWRSGSAAYQVSAGAVFLMEHGIRHPDEPMPERVKRLTRRHSAGDGELSLQNLAQQIAHSVSWEERCWAYHMRVLLPAARSRKAAAEARAVAEAARVARHTCAVCGEVKSDTSARGITAAGRLLRGPNTSNDGLMVQACELCAEAVHKQYVERHASVNGRQRSDLAAAWLDRHTS